MRLELKSSLPLMYGLVIPLLLTVPVARALADDEQEEEQIPGATWNKVASEEYEPGQSFTTLLDDNCRNLWAMPAEVSVLDMNSDVRGSTADQWGGGHQPGLGLEAAVGRDYPCWPMYKDPKPLTPDNDWMQQTDFPFLDIYNHPGEVTEEHDVRSRAERMKNRQAAPVSVASRPPPGPRHAGPFVLFGNGMTGGWNGYRDRLKEKGVDLWLSWLTIGQSIVDGGIEQTSKATASVDFHGYFDTEKMGLWKNGHALVRFESKWGRGVNNDTGALLPVNFDAFVPTAEKRETVVSEWWYSHDFFEGRLEILAGMWDVARFYDNAIFAGPYPYRNLNGSLGMNDILLPFTPYHLLGGAVVVNPNDRIQIVTGIGDPGSSSVDINWYEDGDVNVLHQWRFQVAPGGKPGNIRVGGAYTNKDHIILEQDFRLLIPSTDSIDSDTVETNEEDWAFYVDFDQFVVKGDADPFQGIGIWASLGFSDGKSNLLKGHYAAGVSFNGMKLARPQDRFALSYFYLDPSEDFPSELGVDASHGIEAYYNFGATPWLQLTPHVQLLIDPGVVGMANTVVAGLRMLVLF